MGRLTDCFSIQPVSFHFMYCKQRELNGLTFFSFSGNTQNLQYGDNKSLYKFLEVLLSSRLTITEYCVSILKKKNNSLTEQEEC